MTKSSTMNSSSANSPNEQQIIEAVNLQRDEAIALLCQLVSQPSLLGNEKLAQDVMRCEFERDGLLVHVVGIVAIGRS